VVRSYRVLRHMSTYLQLAGYPDRAAPPSWQSDCSSFIGLIMLCVCCCAPYNYHLKLPYVVSTKCAAHANHLYICVVLLLCDVLCRRCLLLFEVLCFVMCYALVCALSQVPEGASGCIVVKLEPSTEAAQHLQLADVILSLTCCCC
jgi:hypothetical protein